MANTKLERQAKEFIKGTVYGYLNGCYDDDYEPMTEQDWIEYVWNTIEYEKGFYTNGVEPTHFYFVGKDRFIEMTRDFIRKNKDVQPYLIK